MKSESMLATEKMLDVVKTLLDEEQPEALFPKILEVAKGVLDVAKDVLHADAAVLDIGGEEPLHFSNPEKVSISISAVKLAKSEKRAVVWNQLDDESADLSKSIVQNQLTSIMVSPFRTPDSEAGYLYLQRAARKEPFTVISICNVQPARIRLPKKIVRSLILLSRSVKNLRLPLMTACVTRNLSIH